jgi:hypothetical protein
MNPEFTVAWQTEWHNHRCSYRSLARAILDATRHRVPVLHDGAPVTWRAAREGRQVKLTAWLAVGGAR